NGLADSGKQIINYFVKGSVDFVKLLSSLGLNTAEAATTMKATGNTLALSIVSDITFTGAAENQLKTLTSAAQAIGTPPPVLDLNIEPAGKKLGSIASTIVGLQNLQPQISLQDNVAGKVLGAVASTIMGLQNLKPQISLKNSKAMTVIDAVAKRIMSLEKLTPQVNVKVNYTGVKKFAKGGEFITHGPELIMVGDNPGGAEKVKITPTGIKESLTGYRRVESSGGDTYVTVKLQGNDIVNERKWT